MALFTEEYIENYKTIYDNEHKKPYRTDGKKWLAEVNQLTNKYNTTDVLVYGCGVCELQKEVPYELTKYDPAIPEYKTHPDQPHDILICTDVLEHIEPECIDEVLDDLQQLTKKAIFLNIARNKAGKILPDGRNAHVLLKPPEWWRKQLNKRFKLNRFDISYRSVTVVGTPL